MSARYTTSEVTCRSYFDRMVTRYAETGDAYYRREAVTFAFHASDAAWATGEREASAAWETLAEGVPS